MGKIFLSKTTKIEINELRTQGMSDQDIFSHLSDKYYDKDELAKTIKATIKLNNLEKIEKYHIILKVIMFAIIAIRTIIFLDAVFSVNLLEMNNVIEYPLLLMIISSILIFDKYPMPIAFIAIRYEFIIFYILGLCMAINRNSEFDYFSVTNLVSIIIVILAVYYSNLALKIGFPNYKIKDIYKVQQNSNNEYIFN